MPAVRHGLSSDKSRRIRRRRRVGYFLSTGWRLRGSELNAARCRPETARNALGAHLGFSWQTCWNRLNAHRRLGQRGQDRLKPGWRTLREMTDRVHQEMTKIGLSLESKHNIAALLDHATRRLQPDGAMAGLSRSAVPGAAAGPECKNRALARWNFSAPCLEEVRFAPDSPL